MKRLSLIIMLLILTTLSIANSKELTKEIRRAVYAEVTTSTLYTLPHLGHDNFFSQYGFVTLEKVQKMQQFAEEPLKASTYDFSYTTTSLSQLSIPSESWDSFLDNLLPRIESMNAPNFVQLKTLLETSASIKKTDMHTLGMFISQCAFESSCKI